MSRRYPPANTPTTLRFAVRAWSAWAGDLDTQEAWRTWSKAPYLPPAAPPVPPLAEMAAMLRRRLPPLGRVALAPVYACERDHASTATMPAVFSSRHGDTPRLVPMLTDLAAGEPLSPTAFGLSVHNAIGAVRAIDLTHRANLQALSAGRDTVETAVVEACSLLADGAHEVLLVYYEAPLAAPYASFVDEPEALYSWCWRLALPGEDEPCYTLTLAGEDAVAAANHVAELPHGLDVLRFVLTGEESLTYRGEVAAWHWKYHG